MLPLHNPRGTVLCQKKIKDQCIRLYRISNLIQFVLVRSISILLHLFFSTVFSPFLQIETEADANQSNNVVAMQVNAANGHQAS